ncbi:MAG: Gfo/Idh/MocA family oxidoreductase, partial [Deltaproteobacteria bacterium]|nr:Gfo/Idh/MocA family oxidoreductase [Deltaproteobacteria bacterium]
GSIGRRHFQNLKTLGFENRAMAEPDPERREALAKENTGDFFETLEAGLDWQPDAVIIATPSSLHAEQALAAARRGCHLFIEKPLSHKLTGLPELSMAVMQMGLISLVGCNMRWHPGPAKVKALLDSQAVGRVLFARLHTGSYLPEWRPTQDYRRSYSANAALGGGCILDCIHEIDLARWYLGQAWAVFCLADHVSSLELDVEDVAVLLCKHDSGAFSEIHLDFVQRTYERGCQIVGEHGSIFWDFMGKMVKWYEARTGQWMNFEQAEDWTTNDMYLDELAHFLDCVASGTQTVLPVSEAIRVMEIVEAARMSNKSGRLTPTKTVG